MIIRRLLLILLILILNNICFSHSVENPINIIEDHPSDREIKLLYNRLDKDNDGKLSYDEFLQLKNQLTTQSYVKPEIIDSKKNNDFSLLQLSSQQAPKLAKARRRSGHPGGCYRVCPTPIVFRSGEPFGGPFGPDPYYSYGHNHMY